MNNEHFICFKNPLIMTNYKTQIHKIVLVGSSTGIPKVRELLKDLFHGEKEYCKAIESNEANLIL